MNAIPRLALFGGSFDPPHCGHRQLVEVALQILGIERCLVVPVGRPVHRQLSGRADGATRLRWLRQLFADEPCVTVLDWEVSAAHPVATIETLRRIHAEYPGVFPLLLLGADAFAGLAQWIDYPAHRKLCDIALFGRCGTAHPAIPAGWQEVTLAQWQEQPGYGRVVHIDAELPTVSATLIRRRCALRESLAGLVPAQLLAEITATYSGENLTDTQTVPVAAAASRRPELAEAVLQTIEDIKGIDPLIIDVRGRTPLTDTFIIASGRSSRHLKGIADAVSETAHKHGLVVHIEGLEALEWLLLDLGDVIVHLFLPEVRSTFAPEKLWTARPSTTL